MPLRSLAIEPGKAARVLFVDVVCMAYNGNIVDAALLAIMAALQNSQFCSGTVSFQRSRAAHLLDAARLPRVRWDADAGQVMEEEGEKLHLQLKNTVLAASFSIFDSCVCLCIQVLSILTQSERIGTSFLTLIPSKSLWNKLTLPSLLTSNPTFGISFRPVFSQTLKP